MNKYYHRGNGECVCPDSNEQHRIYAKANYTESGWDGLEADSVWDNCLKKLSITAYCDPQTPVGWMEEYIEMYQCQAIKQDEPDLVWIEIRKEVYDHAALSGDRRIFLAKTKPSPAPTEGVEELKKEIERLKNELDYAMKEGERLARVATYWQTECSQIRQPLK